jgi:hypothetical protein
MYTVVGHCAKCGSPIYAPTMWMGVTPPPSTPSCACFAGDTMLSVGTSTGAVLTDKGKKMMGIKSEKEGAG